MSEEQTKRLKKQLSATIKSLLLDSDTEREPNRQNPATVATGAGFLEPNDAAARTLNTAIPRRLPIGNRDASDMIQIDSIDGEGDSSSDPSDERSSIPHSGSYPPPESVPRDSKVVALRPDTPSSNWVPSLGGNITHSHIRRIFSEHPDWVDVIRYDTYLGELVKHNAAPWGGANSTWTDIDTNRAKCWLSDKFGCTYSTSSLEEVLSVIGHDNQFHSLQHEIINFKWDGVPRIHDWVCRYLLASESDYHKEVGQKFIISAIARAIEPGCKADHVLILEGPTGARKSTAIEVLAGSNHFSDSPIDLNSVFAPAQLQGVWFYELSERTLFQAFSNQRTKHFLSQKEDHYSPKNIRRKIRQKRGNVFTSTSNDSVYLNDPTGDRRIWPVSTGRDLKIDLIARDRENIFGEAYHYYKLFVDNGRQLGPYSQYQWWLDDEYESLARKEQEKRYLPDSWEETISEWMSKNERKILEKGYITTSEIMIKALKIKPGRFERKDEMKISTILTSRFSWRKGERLRTAQGRVYPYYPPNGEE